MLIKSIFSKFALSQVDEIKELFSTRKQHKQNNKLHVTPSIIHVKIHFLAATSWNLLSHL